MKKTYYKGFYGCTASIAEEQKGYRLKIRIYNGTLIENKVFKTERGARIALGKSGEGWQTA